MNPILLIDTNYLCHRAFHAMGALTHEDIGVGAVYGVLRDIVFLQEQFASTRCVFAFDPGGRGHRHDLLPGYKASRHARYADESEEDQAARASFREQVVKLRTEYLPAAGFKNIFCEPGFEADDIIASIAAGIPDHEEAVIVSADQDLWQCLRRNVWNWNPQKKKGYDKRQFIAQWGLSPSWWPAIKALAGCSTDDVIGVKGVGEVKAATYYRGGMNPKTQTWRNIKAASALCKSNLRIVSLPFPGTPVYTLGEDEVTEEKWQALADSLGMHSIRNMVPRVAPRKSKGRKRGKKQPGFGLDST